MATRLKTIEFVLPTNTTSLGSNTRRDLAAGTIYIPENSGTITFRSVVIQVTAADDATAGGSISNWLMGIKLGAVAFNDVTVTDTVTNSGEAQAYHFSRDVTSYFTTNWTGTSMTWQVAVQYASRATQNHCAKILISYEYDDTQTVHIKTIRVPIESTRSVLTTTMQTVGGATAIPDFGGSYLPEASVTVRQVWVELWGNEVQSSTGDFIAQYRINGGTSISFWDTEAALASGRWAYGIGDITAEDLSSARSLECAVTTTTNRFDQCGGLVCVTYEFNPASSTTILNSLILGAVDTSGYIGGTTLANQDVWERSIFIEEPGTITLRASGVALFCNDSAGFTMTVGAGAQNKVAYVFTASTIQAGQYSCVHRIDSGSQDTSGVNFVTLARGRNTYRLEFRSDATSAGWNLSGFLVLNYTSSKMTDGVGAHSHSVYHHIGNTAADTTTRTHAPAAGINIPEANYWLNSVVMYVAGMSDNATGLSFCIQAERQSGEAEGDGWETIYVGTARADNENQNFTIWGATRKAWQRWTNDPDTDRMDVETQRDFRFDSSSPSWTGMGMWVTYHTRTFAIAGDVTGSAGGTVNIDAFRVSNDEKIMSTSRSGNGAYSMTWYDDVEEVYTVAIEDGTHLGRSANGTAA